MIDNWTNLKTNLVPYPDNGDVFYMFQIITRDKDYGEGNKIVNILYGDFYDEEFMDRLRRTTEFHKARTYIKVNRCEHSRIALRCMEKIAKRIVDEQYDMSRVFDSVCGSYTPKIGNMWIIDIDDDLVKPGESFDLQPLIDAQKVVQDHPHRIINDTVNGYHVIVRPYDTRLVDTVPQTALLKNGCTLLFSHKDAVAEKAILLEGKL